MRYLSIGLAVLLSGCALTLIHAEYYASLQSNLNDTASVRYRFHVPCKWVENGCIAGHDEYYYNYYSVTLAPGAAHLQFVYRYSYDGGSYNKLGAGPNREETRQHLASVQFGNEALRNYTVCVLSGTYLLLPFGQPCPEGADQQTVGWDTEAASGNGYWDGVNWVEKPLGFIQY